jgi:hypothetical protein
VELGVAGEEGVALGEQHPPPRVEAVVDEAAASWTDGAGAPEGTYGAEVYVVE